MIPFIYAREGHHFVPTTRASSPWEPGKQNGIAVAGLLVHLLETLPAPAGMSTARLTIDIISTVPLAPVTGRARLIKDGRQMQFAEAEMVVDGRIVARATALRVRMAETPAIAEANPYPPPEDFADCDFMPTDIFGDSLRTRLVKGALRGGI